jgi:hypothetical protein
MILVRYMTLVALVIWLGAMVDERFPDLFRRAHLVGAVCGAVTVTGLFVLKFVGPPPLAFVTRLCMVLLMAALALAAAFAARDTANLLLTVNIGLGLGLLVWYVRE